MKSLSSIAVLVLIGLFLLAYSQGLISFPASLTTGEKEMLLVPLLGYFKCERLATTQDVITISRGVNEMVLCDVYTPSCTITNNGPTLYYCTENERGVGLFGVETCTKTYTWSRGETKTVSRGIKYYIWPSYGTGELVRSYDPYTLYQYPGTGGRFRVYNNEYKCSPPVEADLCIEGDKCIQGTWKGALDFDESVNYLDKWVLGPVDPETTNLVNHPVYGRVYCSAGQLYSVGKITLESGTYLYPDKYLTRVECCPGEVSGNLVCGSDFKWKEQSTQKLQCFTDFQCPGQGAWMPDYSDVNRKTAIKYSCVNNVCVAQTKETICTTNEACPTGTVCMLDPTTGEGRCVKSGSVPTKPREVTLIQSESTQPTSNWFTKLQLLVFSMFLGFIVVFVASIFIPILRSNITRIPLSILIGIIIYAILGGLV